MKVHFSFVHCHVMAWQSMFPPAKKKMRMKLSSRTYISFYLWHNNLKFMNTMKLTWWNRNENKLNSISSATPTTVGPQQHTCYPFHLAKHKMSTLIMFINGSNEIVLGHIWQLGMEVTGKRRKTTEQKKKL